VTELEDLRRRRRSLDGKLKRRRDAIDRLRWDIDDLQRELRDVERDIALEMAEQRAKGAE
jgi:uncharacterized coiled-coil DUF342 family protein